MPDAGGPGRPPLLALAIATAGGAGLLRPAPGTWGSIVAMLVALIVLWLAPVGGRWIVLGGLALALATSVWAVPRAVRWFRRGDPSQVVIDEVAGVWIAVVVLPGVLLAEPLTAVLVAGILFRVFDIAKPGPIGALESASGTTGIMADDCAAGLLAGALTTAILA